MGQYPDQSLGHPVEVSGTGVGDTTDLSSPFTHSYTKPQTTWDETYNQNSFDNFEACSINRNNSEPRKQTYYPNYYKRRILKYS